MKGEGLNAASGWVCHVCGRQRPDEYIDVAKHVHINGSGIEVIDNVRYCNDEEACTEVAMLRSHSDLALWFLQAEYDTLKEYSDLAGLRAAFFVAIAFILGYLLHAMVM